VLVLGGGDGLAVREILRHAHMEQVTLVDLDPAMTDLFTRNEYLAGLNGRPCPTPGHGHQRRRRPVAGDPREVFDLIIADFPDPPASASASSTRCPSTA
jgi:spermidine synthase